MNISRRQIPSEEVSAHSLSFSDYNGRLFCWQGEIYRAIPPDQSPLYRELFDCGGVRSLVENKLLVPTELTQLSLANSGMVLRHHRIPFISYPAEWCDAMFKAATLHHLDFCLLLDRYDCTTDDAHPINILFEGCNPYFVDFGSINRLPQDRWYPWPWPPYEQFCQTFLYPLLLKAHGQNRMARWSLHDFEQGVLKSDLDALIDRPFSQLRLAEIGAKLTHISEQPLTETSDLLRPLIRKGSEVMGRLVTRLSGIKSSRQGFLQQVRAEVASISLSGESTLNERKTGWQGEPTRLPENAQQVQQILSDLNPGSVLDINSGKYHGDYALMAAIGGAQVVAIDPEEANVRALYYRARVKNHNILPLWLNFASPSYGLSNQFLAPAHQRLRCELVLALALDSELLLKRGFDFVIDRLAFFSSRWLLIEFVPQAAPTLTTRWMERTIDCSWYRLDNFVSALKGRFNRVEVLPAALPSASGSRLLLCEK